MDELVSPWDVLEYSGKGLTHQARFQRDPYRVAAVKSWDKFRFNRDLIDFLGGFLVDFALHRFKENKNTGRDLITQEAFKRGEQLISYGYELNFNGNIVLESSLELVMWEFYHGKGGLWVKEPITNDLTGLEEACMKSINANGKAVAEFKSGKESAINPIKGPVIKEFKGKIAPNLIDERIRKMLNGL